MSDEAFIPTVFCPNCKQRTVAEVVEGVTHEGESTLLVVCVECNDIVNLTHDAAVRMYTPSEVMEIGWDLFEVIAKLEEDRWSKIKPLAN